MTGELLDSPALLVRRERDLNPRYPYGYTRLPIAHLRPLGHLSKKGPHFYIDTTKRGSVRIPRRIAKNNLRREGDSNPRNPYGFNGFRDRPIQPLSHLSKAMRLRGFEPPTFRSAIWRSIQLSYSLARAHETADPSAIHSCLAPVGGGSVRIPRSTGEKTIYGEGGIRFSSLPSWKLLEPASPPRGDLPIALPPSGRRGLGSNPPIDWRKNNLRRGGDSNPRCP